MDFDVLIQRFFQEDVRGILVTGADGEILYQDDRSSEIIRHNLRWRRFCPPPKAGERGMIWELSNAGEEKQYEVISSTMEKDGALIQIHHFMDNSFYMELIRDVNDYSSTLKSEKEHDDLTGLYNKGKLMQLEKTLFKDMDAIAVFNMDVNNLKRMNDTYGHEAGDKLICKAAESLHRIEARNVLTFRTGGDEFMAVALHVSREGAEDIRRRWEEGLAELNRRDDGVKCVIACGMAYGERGYDLEEVLALADQRMYEDKRRKKENQ